MKPSRVLATKKAEVSTPRYERRPPLSATVAHVYPDPRRVGVRAALRLFLPLHHLIRQFQFFEIQVVGGLQLCGVGRGRGMLQEHRYELVHGLIDLLEHVVIGP